jgi:ribose transport system substrate-binding protein
MKRVLIVFFFLALLFTPACEKAESDRPLVGITLLNKQDVFYQDLEAGMREAAEEVGIDLLVQSAEKDLSAQTAQVENFIVRGVDAIVACPVDSRGIAQVLKRAADEGVAVFTADIAAEGIDVVAHVASDNVQGGRLAGEYLGQRLEGAAAVAVVDHPEVTSVQDRVAGFLEVVEADPELTLAARPSAQGRRDMALDVAASMLQAHPEVRGVFAINDETALGVVQALDSLGRDDVIVVGYDAIPEARAAILAGSPLEADVVQYPHLMGQQVIHAVNDHLAGKPVDPVQAVTVGMVTRESLGGESEPDSDP